MALQIGCAHRTEFSRTSPCCRWRKCCCCSLRASCAASTLLAALRGRRLRARSPLLPSHRPPASAKVQWKRRGCQNDGLDFRLREPHLRFNDRAARARVRRVLARQCLRLGDDYIIHATRGDERRENVKVARENENLRTAHSQFTTFQPPLSLPVPANRCH